MRRKGNPIFILFASLAIVGLINQLLFNTQGFLVSILVTILVIGLFIVLYKFLTKQQRVPVRHGQAHRKLEQHRLKTMHRKREHSFRVIEGSKGKKNKPHSS